MKTSLTKIKKNLFLTGTSGSGKSTLILNCLLPYLNDSAGFATVRLNDDHGKTIAFQHVAPFEYRFTEKKYNGNEKNCIIDYAKKIKSLQCFHSFACPQLIPSDSQKWILMDEIGGFELTDTTIQNAFLDALKSSYPCLGVIKWIGPNSHLRTKCHKKQEVLAWDQFIEAFMKTDTTVLHMDELELNQIEQIIHQWISLNITKGD